MRSVFDDIMTDKIQIEKVTGEKFGNLKALVSGNIIHCNRSDILIEPNDIIVRTLSNGGMEEYQVIDPCFYEEFAGEPSHYQIKVKKIGVPEPFNRISTVTTININGDSARVNNNSIDNSINIFNSNELHQELGRLITKLEQLEDDCKDEISSLILGLKEEQRKEKPNKKMIELFLQGLPLISPIIDIGEKIRNLF